MGVLLLFMIGLFTVQLDFKPILVDDDVGMEYVDNLNSFNDNAILTVIENPGQVASPLKYPMIVVNTIYTVHDLQVIHADYCFLNDDNISKQFAHEANKRRGYSTNVPETGIITGLYRLEIGDRFSQNLKA